MTGKKDDPGALAGATGANCEAEDLQKDHTAESRSRQQKWRDRHPKKYLGHLAVQNALRLGLIEKLPCAVCGDPKSEAHHEDYDRPYDVQWLCRAHHKAVHSDGRREK